MSQSLRVLIVGDSEDDVQQLLSALPNYDTAHERVDDAEGMVSALRRGPWDVIIADYAQANFGAAAALALLEQQGSDLPLLVVSSQEGEENAVQMMSLGADDYLSKDSLGRLSTAVDRCLRDAGTRAPQRKALRLARQKSATTTAETEPAAPPQGKRGRVLIAEDNDAVRAVLSRVLHETHTVDIFSSGAEALEHFAPDRYDAALIDLGLPEIPGDQVAEQLKGKDPLLSLVLITGWLIPEDDPRRSAFDFLLQKPFDPDDVHRLVAEALELHETRLTDGSSPT